MKRVFAKLSCPLHETLGRDMVYILFQWIEAKRNLSVVDDPYQGLTSLGWTMGSLEQ